MDPYLAVVAMFAGNFAPRGWAFCHGQLISISQNTALFSLLGTTFGGNGQTTFALPDLRSRTPIHPGQGPGLPNVVLGEMSGSENATLISNNLPAHNHIGTITMGVSTTAATTDEPLGSVPATGSVNTWQQGAASDGNLGGVSAIMHTAGSSQPFSIRQPYIAINFIIAMEGVYPSRN
jgi:microcystin-dependent protein